MFFLFFISQPGALDTHKYVYIYNKTIICNTHTHIKTVHTEEGNVNKKEGSRTGLLRSAPGPLVGMPSRTIWKKKKREGKENHQKGSDHTVWFGFCHKRRERERKRSTA